MSLPGVPEADRQHLWRRRVLPRADVEPQGEAREYSRIGGSGSPVVFHFCPNCGSSVYWEPGRAPDLIGVAVGAFADPDFPAPSQSVFTQRRHAWVVDR
ncbi:GFA family protein [Bradyrhizobium quebecense]|uniref:GFA family protein n=1 Tax=Bradyrhizobium quebecense TaxID=2748629 RepID=UPI0030845EB8